MKTASGARSLNYLRALAFAPLMFILCSAPARADEKSPTTATAPAKRETLFENSFDGRETWNRDPKSGTLTCADGIGTFQDTRKGDDLKNVSPPTWTISAKGDAPAGSYLEIKIKAPTDVQYWVDLVNNSNASIATIPLGAGTGDWQIRRVPFEGQFGSKGDDLFVRVRKTVDDGGDSVQIDYVGIYKGDAAMQDQAKKAAEQHSRLKSEDNLALAKHECYVLSSSFQDVADNYTDHLIDGDGKTSWRSWPQAPMPQWVELRWEYPVQINRLWLRPAPNGWPQRFSVQRMEHETWSKIKTFDAPKLWPTAGLEFPFDVVTTDHLRISFDAADGDAVSLAEVEAYGPPQPLVFKLRPYWHAHYIWFPEPDKQVKIEPRYFRKTFDVADPDAVSSAFLQVRSNDNYIITINGKEAARGSIVIQPIDVKQYLRKGLNCIAARADVRKDPSWPLMTFLAEMTINETSGTRAIVTDPTWRASATAPDGWQQPEFDDTAWPSAFICATPPDHPWGRIPYFDLSHRQQVKVEKVTLNPERAAPGQRVSIEAQLRPLAPLGQDYLFLFRVGEREINSDRSNYVVAKGMMAPEKPTSQWKVGETQTIRCEFDLPAYAPRGTVPIRFEAMGMSTSASIEFINGNDAHAVDADASLQVDRPGATTQPIASDSDVRVSKENGVCKIVARGQTYSPLLWALQSPSLDRYQKYSAAGIHLYHLQIYPYRLDQDADFRGAHFAFIDQHVRELLAIDPSAKVLVEMDLRDAHTWSDAHPDDRLVTAQGSKMSQSFASKAYAESVSSYVRQLIRFLNEHDYRDAIIGYIPEIAEPESAMGGSEQNAFQSDRSKLNIGDYNPQAIEMFRHFLREKYADSEDALRAAWKDDAVTFATAKPRLEELTKEGTGGGVFRDPTEGRLAFDYFEFLSTMVPNFVVEHIARVIKEETGGKALVGFYYGYVVETLRACNNPGALLQGNHFHFDKIIDSPFIDFFISPLQYDHRMAGDRMFPFQPLGSVRLHNKLYVAEEDLRTYVSGLTSYGRQRSEQESIAVIQNHLATAIIGGSGAWMADWSAGSGHSRTAVPFFDTPSLLATISKMKRVYDQTRETPRTSATQIAVFVSDKTPYYHDVAYASVLYRNLITSVLYEQMPYLGAPFDIYTMEDAGDPFVLRQYKLYVFLNPFFMTDADRAAVEKLKHAGKTLLFFYAPGYVSNERGLQAEDVHSVSGMSVEARPEKQKLQCVTTDAKHPILQGIAPGTRYSAEGFDYAPETARLHPTEIGPRFVITDPGATVLAHYPDGATALAALDAGGWKSVYAAVPFLDTAALRNIAAWAGVHLYAERGVVVEASGELLMLHNGWEKDRTLDVALPGESEVFDLLEDRVVVSGRRDFRVTLPKCRTLFYQLR